ncbi:MAG: cupredoxin domain-containing protein [Patescibacteria group bacterium]
MKKWIIILGLFIALVATGAILLRDTISGVQPFRLTISNCQGTLDRPLTVKAGETVVIDTTSDQDGELHIHGFDIKRDLTKNQKQRLTFRAVEKGRYELELENQCHLGELVVASQDGTLPLVEQ